MFSFKPQTLQYWYKNFISDYKSDIKNKKWHPQKIEIADESTGEIKEKPVYIFKQENIGSQMSIDDKAIGHEGFTVLSNYQSGKIAMMIESTQAKEVEMAMKLFGNQLNRIKNISMDMSPTYALVCKNVVPRAQQIIDKFHVMKYVYQCVLEVRIRIKKELCAKLSKGKKKTAKDKKILFELERLKRVRHALTQSPDKWSDEMKKTVNHVFEKFNDLKLAYQISQKFKQWYDLQNHVKSIESITKNLHKWYEQARKLDAFNRVIKMIRKHENEIINFFQHGITNANAERTNGKLQRFVSNNYGIKDKDFILYRIAGYFA
jgi:transposase